jgi:ribosomal protein S18 acetylase RimI-like enzyme
MQRPDSTPLSSADSFFLAQPSASGRNSFGSNSALFVRSVRHQDLQSIADVLVSSFHSPEGTFGWLYPLLRLGIYEDLRNRLYSRTQHYACLVAVSRRFDSSLLDLASVDPSGIDPINTNGAEAEADRLVGTVELSVRSRSFNPFLQTRYPYLSNLAVLAECRRQGVALKLLQTCERIALDWGFQEVYLHVLENNHQARRLYWKAGYRLKGIHITPLGFVLGRPRQLLLCKRLSS